VNALTASVNGGPLTAIMHNNSDRSGSYSPD